MTWLVEEGIGEDRAILLDGGRIVAARLHWPGELVAGTVAEAVLVSRAKGSARGTARLPDGEEVLVDRLPASASEGASLRIEVTRPATGEAGRRKRAQARPTDAALRPAPGLAEQLRTEGHAVQVVRSFPDGDGGELLGEALAGEVAFPGGSLLFSPTPAMLLVDVDGTLPPRALALAAVEPLAQALRRFDCGGSIGVDFPTLQAREDRKALDAALAEALAGWPHERTAINGFGFVQIVARLRRPSLLHRAAFRRAALVARAMLRRAERLEGAGAVELTAHPAVLAEIAGPLADELARRSAREVRMRADPALAPDAAHAQLVPR